MHPEAELIVVKNAELEAISSLHTPNQVLMVIPLPEKKEVPLVEDWYLFLDDIQDPGNMGTLIRIADWFGIPNVICTPGCVDFYNSKVVQSAMGGHLRVGLFESDPEEFLKAIQLPKLAATLGGQDVYKMNRLKAGVLIIGNESHGVSGKVLSLTTEQITIPRRGGAESLNAGVSAGILCALLLPC
jgi:TrmH family RNA methyltransferase